MAAPLVTLTTDFGVRDPYAAAMKGVIYAIHPHLTVTDLSHEIPPHDIMEGAFFLAGALPFFPDRTIHVAVVDPGVGTSRHGVVIQAGGQYLVCPDNGIANFFLRRHPVQDARIIENPRFMRREISPTFHGRDIFAPVAAHLARGVPLCEFGSRITRLAELPVPVPRITPGRIEGEVVHIDRFGNLITNITQGDLPKESSCVVLLGAVRLGNLHHTYADVPPGEPLALIGSAGFLEIAIHGGSARAAFQFDRGQAITIETTSFLNREEGVDV